jgi:hypothetical protein
LATFKIGIGHDLLEADLDNFVPYQPKTPGLQWTRRSDAADLSVHEEGPFIRFTWGLMDETQYQALIAQCGLLTLKTRLVTIYAQDDNYVWQRFNAIAVKPLSITRRGYWLYDVPLLAKQLESLG